MKIWIRTHSFHHCSWTIVWNYLRKHFKEQGYNIHEDFQEPDEKVVEFWWGDVSKWEWSNMNNIRVGYAISETECFPSNIKSTIIRNLEKCDMLLCPSEFSARAYQTNPIDYPIKIVPLGVDISEMRYTPRTWFGELKFLLAGASQFRKGTWIGIEAFIRAFHRFSGASMTVWTSVNTPDYHDLMKTYKHPKLNFVYDVKDSPYEMYSEHHVLVSPHLSEGFGIMPLEAMATGMPCIISRTSSPREYFNSDCGWWIEMSDLYVPVDKCIPNTSGFWRLPDLESCSSAMRFVVKNREIVEEKGLKACDHVRDNYAWSHTVNGIANAIKGVMNVSISRDAHLQRSELVTAQSGEFD